CPGGPELAGGAAGAAARCGCAAAIFFAWPGGSDAAGMAAWAGTVSPFLARPGGVPCGLSASATVGRHATTAVAATVPPNRCSAPHARRPVSVVRAFTGSHVTDPTAIGLRVNKETLDVQRRNGCGVQRI